MMKRFRANKDAVSPVIATLLVIAIAVAAAILVYVWAMGLVGTLESGGGEQVTEQIMMDVFSWNATGDLALTLRNVGSSVVTVDAIYVETDSGIQAFDGAASANDNVLAIGDTEIFTCPVTSVTAGVQYTVKIVSESGGVFSFSAICGGSG
ncbi:MAG: hypothetical protein GKB99_04635 [Methanocellales archaeon]|nr:hypothetical protein [Methanocellales archaeon]